MSDDALIEAMARAIAEEYYDFDQVPLPWTSYEGDATAALAALRKTHAVVPKEPSVEMKYAGMEAADCDIGLVDAGQVYRAMLNASEDSAHG